MQRRTDRILTTHVGSLIRPPELLEFLQKKRSGEAIDEAAYDACLRHAVAEIVRQQAAIGIDIVSDGEFGKSITWSRYILERLSGFEQRNVNPDDRTVPTAIVGKDRRDFADFYAEYDPTQNMIGVTGWVVTGPITYKDKEVRRDIDNLKAALIGVGVEGAFMPVVAPGSVAPERKHEYYRNAEESLQAIADALHQEYKAIVDAGFLLQIDDSYLASYYDMIVPPGTLADYRKWATAVVEVLNYALKGIPEEKVRYHVCWGSWNGPHASDVPMKDIVDLVLKIRVGGYSLEMANPRHEHEWRVWESVKLPEGKFLLPGVISHTTNVVEHPELVAERVIRLANLVGRENVIASTDCGFSQGPFMRRVHPSIMWAKLKALVDGARIASKALW